VVANKAAHAGEQARGSGQARNGAAGRAIGSVLLFRSGLDGADGSLPAKSKPYLASRVYQITLSGCPIQPTLPAVTTGPVPVPYGCPMIAPVNGSTTSCSASSSARRGR